MTIFNKTGNLGINVTLRRMPATFAAVRSKKCVVLVIQHARRMRCIVLSSVGCLAVPYISTLSRKLYDFGK
jgi:hypothetical protein